jgi:hypothetical protein
MPVLIFRVQGLNPAHAYQVPQRSRDLGKDNAPIPLPVLDLLFVPGEVEVGAALRGVAAATDLLPRLGGIELLARAQDQHEPLAVAGGAFYHCGLIIPSSPRGSV